MAIVARNTVCQQHVTAPHHTEIAPLSDHAQ
jgi:hypothetical protein